MALKSQYEVNMVVSCELGYNFTTVNAPKNLASWFNDDHPMRSVSAHNIHDKIKSVHQQGGTGMVCFNE